MNSRTSEEVPATEPPPGETSAASAEALLAALVKDLVAAVRQDIAHDEARGAFAIDEDVDLRELAENRHSRDEVAKLLNGRVFDLENAWDENGWDYDHEQDVDAIEEARSRAFREHADRLDDVAVALVEAGQRDADFDGNALREELAESDDFDPSSLVDWNLHHRVYRYQGAMAARASLADHAFPSSQTMATRALALSLASVRITPKQLLAAIDRVMAEEADTIAKLDERNVQDLIPSRREDRYLAFPEHPVIKRISRLRQSSLAAFDREDYGKAWRNSLAAELEAGWLDLLERGLDPEPFNQPPAVSIDALAEKFLFNAGYCEPLVRFDSMSVAFGVDNDYVDNVSRAYARHLDEKEAPLDAAFVAVASGELLLDSDGDRSVRLASSVVVPLAAIESGSERARSGDCAMPAGELGLTVRLYEEWLKARDRECKVRLRAGNYSHLETDAPLTTWDRDAVKAIVREMDDARLRQPLPPRYQPLADIFVDERNQRTKTSSRKSLGQALHRLVALHESSPALLDKARELLRLGANPNARSANGLALVHVAASRCDVELLQLLRDHGADLAATWRPGLSKYSETGLEFALRCNVRPATSTSSMASYAVPAERFVEVIGLLVAGGIVMAENGEYRSRFGNRGNFLYDCYRIGGDGALTRAADCFDNEERRGRALGHALAEAVRRGHAGAVLALLSAGADLLSDPEPGVKSLEDLARKRYGPDATTPSFIDLSGDLSPQETFNVVISALRATRARRAAQSALECAQSPRLHSQA
jgi:hypothetical protein